MKLQEKKNHKRIHTGICEKKKPKTEDKTKIHQTVEKFFIFFSIFNLLFTAYWFFFFFFFVFAKLNNSLKEEEKKKTMSTTVKL